MGTELRRVRGKEKALLGDAFGKKASRISAERSSVLKIVFNDGTTEYMRWIDYAKILGMRTGHRAYRSLFLIPTLRDKLRACVNDSRAVLSKIGGV